MTEVSQEQKATVCMLINANMQKHVPHNRALGLELFDYGDDEVWLRLPYDPKLVGNPATGVIHGGAISSLMDAACGMAVMMKLGKPSPIATLDLRIDYMKPAAAGRAVIAHGRCYKLTRHVCFVRGSAYIDDPSDPVATVAATFARKPKPGKEPTKEQG